MKNKSRLVWLSVGSVTLACGFDRERDITSHAVGGGSVTVSCTGALTFSDTIPGITQAALDTLDRSEFEVRRAFLLEAEGRSFLEVNPGHPTFQWAGAIAATPQDWMTLSLHPDGRLRASIGMYVSYPGDSGWMLEGTGAPVDLTVPGRTTVAYEIVQNGVTPAGRGTCELGWSLDPAVNRTWTEHYRPRRH